MNKITVNCSKPYEVVIGRDIIDEACDYIKSNLTNSAKILIVCDEKAPCDFKVYSYLKWAGFFVKTMAVHGGDSIKTYDNVKELLSLLISLDFSKSDLLIAMGGGSIIDFVGFSASVYKRGIKYINIPTTLLSMADACIGGKTAVDFCGEKNAVGTFWQPSFVVCDIALAERLPKEVYNQGLSEAVKCAVLCDKEFFDKIDVMSAEQIIAKSLTIKAHYVSKDEFDTGDRRFLNLGHTFAHSIEGLSNFTISHGDAVAMGLVIAAEYSNEKGLMSISDVKLITDKLKTLGLPTKSKYSKEEIFLNIKNDKKISNGKINFILPKTIGECVIYKEEI